MITEAIAKVVDGNNLSPEEMAAAFNQIMTGEATPAQVGAFLIALRMKGETSDEVMGAARSMREHAVKVEPPEGAPVVDLCGTGGDGAHTFNISTAASFVTSGAGAVVAKHGNRSVSSRCGSADVLEELGVRIDAPPEVARKAMQKAKMAFLFAPVYHPAMKHAIGPRRELKLRTIFNILGPLTNPAGAKRQLLGVHDASIMRMIVEALKKLGSDRILVVHSRDGLDEASISAETDIFELKDGGISEWSLAPEDAGLKRAPRDSLKGGQIQDNAKMLRDALAGGKGPVRDATVLNAGLALMAAGMAEDVKTGARIAEDSIDSGNAARVLENLIKVTKES
jgi:anthranilate phosphoribosyltransferase